MHAIKFWKRQKVVAEKGKLSGQLWEPHPQTSTLLLAQVESSGRAY